MHLLVNLHSRQHVLLALQCSGYLQDLATPSFGVGVETHRGHITVVDVPQDESLLFLHHLVADDLPAAEVDHFVWLIKQYLRRQADNFAK